MSRTLTCRSGHRWEADPGGGPRTPCPVCGAAAVSGPEDGPGPLNGTTLDYPPPTPTGEEAVTLLSEPVPPSGGKAVEQPAVAGYEVLGELGRGGMGVVYQARHKKLNRLVALKMILHGGHAGAADLARFRLEGEAVAQLQHPNIVQIYEVGEQDGRPYCALEFVDGGSLADRLSGQPLPPGAAAGVVEQLARAMHAAHQRGIIHRDLKPANVLLTGDGTPKITDFGLAKQLDACDGPTRTGAVMGTPSYMAPEQAEGRGQDVGPATDIYALGAILYECLTGRPPFRADTALDTVMQLRTEEPPRPRQLRPRTPRDLETICLRCLEKKPDRRYPSALALAEDCAAFLKGEPITARPVGPLGQLVRWAGRQPALATTLIGLVLFYACHLLCLTAFGVPGEGGAFHWEVTGLMLIWAAGAWLFQRLVRRAGWTAWATFAWASTDVVLFTVLLLLANGPSSPLLLGYLLLTGGAALRFRQALVWFVNGLSAAGYLALVVHAARWRPEVSVPLYHSFIFLVNLTLMGLILHLLLRRVHGPGPAGNRG